MPSLAPRYDEAIAKAEWLRHMGEIAAQQDLSEDVRLRTLVLTIAFTVLAAIVVAMRFLARHRQGAAYLIDDWMIVVSLLILFGNTAMNIVCTSTEEPYIVSQPASQLTITVINQGVGLHTGALTVDQLATMNQVRELVTVPDPQTGHPLIRPFPRLLWEPKSSTLPASTYIRSRSYCCTCASSRPPKSASGHASWAAFRARGTLGPSSPPRSSAYRARNYGSPGSRVDVSICRQTPRVVETRSLLGKRAELILDPPSLRFLTQLCVSVPVIILDISILLLPLPHVWRLKTNTTQRVFLTIIFLLGSYVVFTSIYRFVIFLRYTNEDNSCKFRPARLRSQKRTVHGLHSLDTQLPWATASRGMSSRSAVASSRPRCLLWGHWCGSSSRPSYRAATLLASTATTLRAARLSRNREAS